MAAVGNEYNVYMYKKIKYVLKALIEAKNIM